ncbi:hypothetical protein SUDANB95_07947 (plasmid) [Actinosynnema sp. ALI-1.44]
MRAYCSLQGLVLGDAFGEQFVPPADDSDIQHRKLPPPPWRWTDDSEMAFSIVRMLAAQGVIDQDVLVQDFAAHRDLSRGYGRGANDLLDGIRAGKHWSELAPAAFGGRGSWGNGAAMRVAPLGAWFGDVDQAAEQAALSAEITHSNPEAVAGAVAVAVAAALLTSGFTGSASDLLNAVYAAIAPGMVADGLLRAAELVNDAHPSEAAKILGTGIRMSAPDTVPFALWCAARHLGDIEDALWTVVSVGGDTDTIGAIAGGVIAAGLTAEQLPAELIAAVEPFPAWLTPTLAEVQLAATTS